MSDSLSAIRDDIENYQALCQEYNEEESLDKDGDIDCYGEHAKYLTVLSRKVWKFTEKTQEKLRAEYEKKIKDKEAAAKGRKELAAKVRAKLSKEELEALREEL